MDKIVLNSTKSVHILLEKTMISGYKLGVTYGQGTDSKMKLPIDAYSFTTGIVSGTVWNPQSIVVYPATENKFRYSVSATIEWRLLGAGIYTQLKSYEGFVTLK